MRSKSFRINIHEIKWRVVFRKPTDKDIAPVDGKDQIGLCDFEKNEILVSPDENILGTAIHEVLHAYYPQLSEEAIEGGEEVLLDLLSKIPKELLPE